MKKYRLALCLLLCTSLMASCLTINAAEQASDYINEYTIEVTPMGDGDIAIDFSVTGTDVMTKLGAECITVYYRSGIRWVFAGEYTREESGMYGSNRTEFSNTICFHGTEGTYYKIQVEVFAEDTTGSDSAFQTFYVTA